MKRPEKLKLETFEETPMGKALTELATELEKQNMPPVELNVIGGFALMLRGIRDPDGITDIDYVGTELSDGFDELADRIGLKYGMGKGWINNDGMLTGDSMEDFELSTGKLHFEHAFTVGPMKINVLDERDLLRMKVIALDTAMAELEASGSFARMKDLKDTYLLMQLQDVHTSEQIEAEFGEYLICGDKTKDLLQLLDAQGPNVTEYAVERQAEKIRAEQERRRTERKERSPFMKNLMANLMRESKDQAFTDAVENLSDSGFQK